MITQYTVWMDLSSAWRDSDNHDIAIGRIVHYVAFGTPGGEYPKTCRAAMITEVHLDSKVSLAVVNPTGLFFNTFIRFDAEGAGGTWHWHWEHEA